MKFFDLKKLDKQTLAAVILIPVAGVVFFMPLLNGPFLFDDLHTIRDNPHIRGHLSLAYFFKHPESASRLPSTTVRPLLTWTYALDFRRAGADPRAFRTTNLFLHVLNALLIFGLTRKTRSLKALALPCGLLFLLHPLTSIEIGYVSNRSTLLSSCFYLSAMLVYVSAMQKQDQQGPRWRSIIAAAVIFILYAAGLSSKAVAATLPASVLIWRMAFPTSRENPKSNRGDFFTVSLIAGLIILLAIFLIYRNAVSAPAFFPTSRPWPVWEYAAAEVRIFWTYVRLMLWPICLSLEHDAWAPDTIAGLGSLKFLASLAGLIALFALSMKFLRRAPEVCFAALFSILYLLPTSSAIPLTMLANENRPYLSILLVLWPLLVLGERARKTKPWAFAVAFLILGISFVSLLELRSSHFSSELAAWRDTVKKAPQTARAWVNLGAAYSSYGKTQSAQKCFLRAKEVDPCSFAALNNLGNIEDKRGKSSEAERYYRRALECQPQDLTAIINLANLLENTGRVKQSIELLEYGLTLAPDHSRISGNLGWLYAVHGVDRSLGISYLRKARELAASPSEAAEWREKIRSLGYIE